MTLEENTIFHTFLGTTKQERKICYWYESENTYGGLAGG